jgi:hypothetical protein
MFARLDKLLQRHRSVTLYAAAPDVDFRTSMWWERIPGRHDPCSRNSPSHACHDKAPAIGISLAEIAGITRAGQRPARAGPREWRNACGNCENLRHSPPARYRDRNSGGAERSETHFSGPIAVRKYSWGDACDRNAGVADGDTSYCVPSRMACFCCPSTERKKSLVDSLGRSRRASHRMGRESADRLGVCIREIVRGA